MSVFVDVHLKRSDETIHIKAVSEGVLRRNSAVARNQLNQAPRIGWKDVYLTATNTSRSTIMCKFEGYKLCPDLKPMKYVSETFADRCALRDL